MELRPPRHLAQKILHFDDEKTNWSFKYLFINNYAIMSQLSHNYLVITIIIMIVWLSEIFVHIIFCHCTISSRNTSSRSIHLQHSAQRSSEKRLNDSVFLYDQGFMSVALSGQQTLVELHARSF